MQGQTEFKIIIKTCIREQIDQSLTISLLNELSFIINNIFYYCFDDQVQHFFISLKFDSRMIEYHQSRYYYFYDILLFLIKCYYHLLLFAKG